MQEAKIFMNGMSQAVRLPKAYRFKTDKVWVSKRGKDVVLTPKPEATWDDFFASNSKFANFILDRSDNIQPQKRDFW